MAGTLTVQTLIGETNETTNVVIKGVIGGDADLSNKVFFDFSNFAGPYSEAKITKIQFATVGFSAQLLWDATANVPVSSIPSDFSDTQCYKYFGGLINNAGAGKTGDILITTSGLASGDHGHIILYLEKRKKTS